MIEATCSACGTLNRVSDASVPVGAKFLTCADCKSRVAIPPPPAAALPSVPPAIPRPPAKTSSVIDLADLPAPKRASALGPVAPPPIPKPPGAVKPPRSGLAAALDPELPAPKVMRSSGPTPPPLELDELLAASPGAALAAVPAPASATDDGVDLLAPKRAAARPAAEPPRDVIDLPTPKLNRDVTDLPAPKRKPELSDQLMPRDPIAKALSPLPEPPAVPAVKKGPIIPELPAPRDREPRAANADLPAPKGFFDDLPQPALSRGPNAGANTGANTGDRGDDHGSSDLPAPKGFFDDLPQPALSKGHNAGANTGANTGDRGDERGSTDLPAPKGFFDDLPQVKSNPSGGIDVPAPKGFFDDIPGLPHTARPEVPAPKGYFEDIPALPHTARPEVPAPKGFFEGIPGLPHTAKPEVPAPQGYFENVPGRPIKKTDELAPKGFFDDLTNPAQPVQSRGDSSPDLSFDSASRGSGPALDLLPARPGAASFDDLDLSQPSTPGVRFEQTPRTPRHAPDEPPPARDHGLALELEGAPASPALGKPAPRPVKVKPPAEAVSPQARIRRKRIALIIAVAAIALGGVGFVLYQRHAAAKQREAAIAEQLGIARASYAASDPPHWQRAAAAARRVLDLDAGNREALGIAAESLLASALSDGTAAAAKIAQARTTLDIANTAGITSPQLARARALSALAAQQPDGALTQLQALVTAAPKDAALALYLGWALAAKGSTPEAIAAFDRAAADPGVKLLALLGRGAAKRAIADLDGARADFSAALEIDREHIGAQVGLAAAQPPAAAQQLEADLLAILARKDIAAADPRAVVEAWTLCGYAALRAGRGDVARERFRKALAIAPQDLAATTGLAETDLHDGNVAGAAELMAKALVASKDNVPAQLVQSEIEIKQNKLPLAQQRLSALANHATPLAPLEQARLYLTTGKLLEAQGKDDAAIDAYAMGSKAAKNLDLTPMMAAITKLAAMTTAAVAAKDTGRADQLRARADQLLGELAAQAEHEPGLALTLGMAYLQEGSAAKAEPWLRRAVAAHPNDAEAQFQLGRALLKAGNHREALDTLNAALGMDPARADIGVELARAYEAVGRDADAGTLYTKLIASRDPSLELRARAGRFFARTGAIDKAGEQGARILEADPRNPAGLYLKGESLLAAGKPADAKPAFQRAIEVDRDPQYLDGLGRAAEALAKTGDRELQELALRSYVAAAEAAPTMFNPLAGQGRLYVARHEAAKAVTPLLAAAAIDPKNAQVMFLIGAAYQELQQASTALQWLEASMKVAPDDETAWRIAQLYRDANQGARAAAAVTSATRLAAEAEKRAGKPIPWLTDALYLQGRVNLDLHNEAAAREAWLLYVARNPPPSAQLTEVKQQLATTLRR